MRSAAFGRLLRAAIGSIVTHEGTTAPLIEAELGQQIGLSPASIQRYKAGHIPPDPRTIGLLATAGVRRGYLNRVWLAAFLNAARYFDAASLVAQLYPDAAPMPARRYNNLPAPTYAQFVRREAAYADIVEGLRQRSAVVLIAGLGGMGKTSLAREVASDCLRDAPGVPQFAAAVWVSDQDDPGATSLDSVLNEIAFTLDYPGVAMCEPAAKRRQIEQILRRQPVLLVIDQCETISDAELMRWLLRLPEPSKALVTSREERDELRPNCWVIDLQGLSPGEARAFMADRVRALKLERRIGSIAQLDPLVSATGGNPKALEIALGTMKYGPVQQVVEDLAGGRSQVFDQVFARCWSLLDDTARQVLLVTPLFMGTINQDALAVSADVYGESYTAALERLNELALLDVQQPDLAAPPRYALHPLVRAFASARLAEQPVVAHQARVRQLGWYADLAAAVGYCWDDLTRLNMLDPEQETITTLIRWGLANRQDSPLTRLIRGVDYYYYIRGLWTHEPEISYVRVIASQQAGDQVEATKALAYHLQMLCRRDRLAEAEQQLPQLRELSTSADLPPDALFEVQYTFARYAMAYEDYDQAIQLWQQALPLAMQVSMRAYAVSRGWLAICLYRQGAVDQAQALWSDILRDGKAGGFARGVVSSQIGLARIHLDRGESAAAYELLDAAQHVVTAYGDRGTIAEINTLLARYYRLQGEDIAARSCLMAALDTFERLGMAKELVEARQLVPLG